MERQCEGHCRREQGWAQIWRCAMARINSRTEIWPEQRTRQIQQKPADLGTGCLSTFENVSICTMKALRPDFVTLAASWCPSYSRKEWATPVWTFGPDDLADPFQSWVAVVLGAISVPWDHARLLKLSICCFLHPRWGLCWFNSPVIYSHKLTMDRSIPPTMSNRYSESLQG